MEKILLYTKNDEKQKQILHVTKLMKLQVQEISPKDLPRQIGSIAGTMKNAKTDSAVPVFYNMPEVVIFHSLSDGRLDEFLDLYKKNGIEPIPLKAVVTPFNVTWSLYQLIETLKQENSNRS